MMHLYFLLSKIVEPFRLALAFLPPMVVVTLSVAVIAVAVWSAGKCWRRTQIVGRALAGAVVLVAIVFWYWELSFESRFMGRLTIHSAWMLATSAIAFGTIFIGTVWAALALFRLTDEQITEADKRREARRASGDALDWGRLAAFYAPAIIIGGMIAIPLLAVLAANLGIGGRQFEQAMYDMTLDRFIFGSVVLAPAIAAYGTDLSFKLNRFLIVFALIAFMSIVAANRGTLIELQGGATPLPAYVMIVQALIGLPLTWALGQMGLKVRGLFRRTGAQ